jgi:glucosylglycerate phosphorylase
VFLGYVARGAGVIREDAIAYLWKELGTSCLHHPKTHAMVQLMRAVVDEVCPWVIIITETNVPHPENISYFGDGTNEAHMIYNFSLPPLTLDAFMREDSTHLQSWAASLDVGAPMTTYFNFMASHDGVGVLPAKGILSEPQIEAMAAKVIERGGKISYKSTPAGEIPYEMNVNYMDAIADPTLPEGQRARMFLASQSILLALAGVPGIYYHSLTGSGNWHAGVKQTGQNRTINREKLDYDKLSEELNAEGTRRNLVFEGYKTLLRARAISPAFHPLAGQKIISTPKEFFSVLRIDRDQEERVLCLVNISSEAATASFTRAGIDLVDEKGFHDLITGDYVYPSKDNGDRISLELDPYEVLWLKY